MEKTKIKTKIEGEKEKYVINYFSKTSVSLCFYFLCFLHFYKKHKWHKIFKILNFKFSAFKTKENETIAKIITFDRTPRGTGGIPPSLSILSWMVVNSITEDPNRKIKKLDSLSWRDRPACLGGLGSLINRAIDASS